MTIESYTDGILSAVNHGGTGTQYRFDTRFDFKIKFVFKYKS